MRRTTYTAVTLVGLGNHALAHGGGVDGEASVLVEVLDLLLDAVADGACIDEKDRVVLRLFHELDDFVEDELLRLLVVGGRLEVEGRLESLGRDTLVGNIGGEHQIYGAGLKIAACQYLCTARGDVEDLPSLNTQ